MWTRLEKKTEFSFFELSIESHLYRMGGGGCRPIGD